MSVFRVNLNNRVQGVLDKDPTTGEQFETSKQRTLYVMGPQRINRLLQDGDTFTDSNYWKRFAYPQTSLENAFIEVVSDDGSVWSDVISENTYPKVYDVTATGGSTYEDNVVDILGDTGGFAIFTQITNQGEGDVKIKLNGTAIFDLTDGSTQVFNAGDLAINLIEVDNSVSGAGDVDLQILLSVRTVSSS